MGEYFFKSATIGPEENKNKIRWFTFYVMFFFFFWGGGGQAKVNHWFTNMYFFCTFPNSLIKRYRHELGWYSTVQYSTVQYSTIQYNTIQYNTIQYSTVQYSTVQYSTVQYSTVQYDKQSYPVWPLSVEAEV